MGIFRDCFFLLRLLKKLFFNFNMNAIAFLFFLSWCKTIIGKAEHPNETSSYTIQDRGEQILCKYWNLTFFPALLWQRHETKFIFNFVPWGCFVRKREKTCSFPDNCTFSRDGWSNVWRSVYYSFFFLV